MAAEMCECCGLSFRKNVKERCAKCDKLVHKSCLVKCCRRDQTLIENKDAEESLYLDTEVDPSISTALAAVVSKIEKLTGKIDDLKSSFIAKLDKLTQEVNLQGKLLKTLSNSNQGNLTKL
jgi:hypothetical protein